MEKIKMPDKKPKSWKDDVDFCTRCGEVCKFIIEDEYGNIFCSNWCRDEYELITYMYQLSKESLARIIDEEFKKNE